MDKIYFGIIVILVLCFGIVFYSTLNKMNYKSSSDFNNFLNNPGSSPNKFSLSENETRELLFPLIEEYCKTLDKNAKASNYPTCYYQTLNLSYYQRVENISNNNIPQYVYSFKENSIFIQIYLPLIYGYNTRSGFVIGNLTIDSNGNVIEKNLPIVGPV